MEKSFIELWHRLESFTLDKPGIAFPFSARLARENGWSPRYTRRVIEEYKRFIFLAMTAGHPVTPSVDVDQAWHLHLTYTRSYWEDLCANILGAPLHHQPTKGGRSEGTKFHDWYARTLESYERAFGAPPPDDIWPAPEVRLAVESQIRQVSERTHWVIRKPRAIRIAGTFALASIPAVIAGCTDDEVPIALSIICLFIIVGIISVVAPVNRRRFDEGRRHDRGRDGSWGGAAGGVGGGESSGYGGGHEGHGNDGGHGGGGYDGGGGGHGADSSGTDGSGCGGSGCGGSGCGGCGGCGGS